MTFQKGSIRRSLRYSIWDGIFTALMVGVSDSYLIPYGIALGASSSQVALLASVPMLVASILQVRSAGVTQSIGSRTKLINWMVFFHALSWLPIILIPYLLNKSQIGHLAPWALLASVVVTMCCGAFAVPAWQSLMSDYIPVSKRGLYFGWRNRLQGVLTVSVSIIAGIVLHRFKDNEILGFTLILSLAMISRFLAWGCLIHMTEPFRHTSHDIYFSFLDFLKGMRARNFARFVLFVSLMSFAVNISGPQLTVFLLKDLKFSYVHYMVVVTTAALSGFLFQALWGKYGDKFGNLKVLRIAGWGIAFIPFLWLVSHELPYLIFVQTIAGGVWGGFTLLHLNFIMEAVSPEKKIRCIAYFNVVNSFAVFLGAFLGGQLVHRLPPVFGYSFLTLFLISCLGRILVMGFLPRLVSEVRGNES